MDLGIHLAGRIISALAVLGVALLLAVSPALGGDPPEGKTGGKASSKAGASKKDDKSKKEDSTSKPDDAKDDIGGGEEKATEPATEGAGTKKSAAEKADAKKGALAASHAGGGHRPPGPQGLPQPHQHGVPGRTAG